MNHYLKYVVLITGLLFLILSCSLPWGEEQWPVEDITPGTVYCSPRETTRLIGGEIELKFYVNSGTQKIGAYGIHFKFDRNLLQIDTSKSENGAEQGTDGIPILANPEYYLKDPNYQYSVAGLVVGKGGAGPGTKLHLFTVYLKTKAKGTAKIDITVDNLADSENTDKTVGVPKGLGATIAIK